jgi:hypothetical protein
MIKIEITKDAIVYLASYAETDLEDAKAALQIAIGMCYIAGAKDREWFNAKTIKPKSGLAVLGHIVDEMGQFVDIVKYNNSDKSWYSVDDELGEVPVAHWMLFPKPPDTKE